MADAYKDYGPAPIVVNIEAAALANNAFRAALWTGEYLQVTLMSVPVGEDIGVELHVDTDQFIRVEQGEGLVLMGNDSNNLYFQTRIVPGDAVIVPAGTWHNIKNAGTIPLKVYSIYAPPHHPHGTVHITKEDDIAAQG